MNYRQIIFGSTLAYMMAFSQAGTIYFTNEKPYQVTLKVTLFDSGTKKEEIKSIPISAGKTVKLDVGKDGRMLDCKVDGLTFKQIKHESGCQESNFGILGNGVDQAMKRDLPPPLKMLTHSIALAVSEYDSTGWVLGSLFASTFAPRTQDKPEKTQIRRTFIKCYDSGIIQVGLYEKVPEFVQK